MSNIKILSQKPVLRNRAFDVVEYQVDRAGEVHNHNNVILHDDVFVLPITEDNHIYLVSQYRYLLDKVKLEMVAGVIDEGEEPEMAARRELKEETGLTAGKLMKIATFERGASFVKGKWHVYIARELSEGEQEPDGFEDISIVKMPITEALNKIETGEINTAGGVSSLLLADRLMREGKV